MHADSSTNAVPHPGTDAALMRGCKCPVIDNGYGRGWMGQAGVFVYTVGCPLHCPGEEPTFVPRESQESER